MARYVLVVVAAFLCAAGATPVARRAALRLGIMDRPSPRKVHAQPMPYLGGVAIYVAFCAALIAFGDRFYVREAVGILLGASCCSFLGLVDDRQSVGAAAKLAGQAVAAAILVISGVQVLLFATPALNVLLTMLWVVGITNAFNLLDNMDGLAGGVCAVAAAFFLLMAAMSGQYLVGLLAAALLGACIGFLLYNLNPASIFMGDAGSLFLGFVLAAVGIKLRFPANVTFVTWMVPVMVLGMPIADTALVFISRLRRGRNPLTTPGKDHISHRLVRLGHTPREAVLTLYLAGGACGMLATYVMQASIAEGYALLGLALAAGGYAIHRLEQVPTTDAPREEDTAETAVAEPAPLGHVSIDHPSERSA